MLTSEVKIAAEDADEHDARGGHFFPPPARAGFAAIRVGGGAEGQALNLEIVRRGCHVTHRYHNYGRYNRDQHAEVLEVDVIDDPEERSRLVATKSSHAERHGGVDHHAEYSQREAYDHGPEGARPVHTLNKDAEEEHDKDRRRQIALHGLQVSVEALGVLDHRNPGQGDQHHDGGGDAAHAHELMLRSVLLPLLIQVDGKQRGARTLRSISSCAWEVTPSRFAGGHSREGVT